MFTLNLFIEGEANHVVTDTLKRRAGTYCVVDCGRRTIRVVSYVVAFVGGLRARLEFFQLSGDVEY